jgi:hypothetical protein
MSLLEDLLEKDIRDGRPARFMLGHVWDSEHFHFLTHRVPNERLGDLLSRAVCVWVA